MDAFEVFWFFFVISWLIFVFEQYLLWRQYKMHQKNERCPSILLKFMTTEVYAKSRMYQLDKDLYSFLNNSVKQLQIIVFIFSGLMPKLWNFCGNFFSNELLQSNIFFSIFLIFQFFLNLPLNYFDTFFIEQKHGFNKQIREFFFKDQFKKLVFEIVLALPTLSGIIVLVQRGGEYFFFYLWIFVSLVTFFTMAIYPEFIAPMFDKYVPLSNGELKDKIEDLAKKVKFPLANLYVIKGSNRSSHSNAYMYGFGRNKRIVLFDTLFGSDKIEKMFGDTKAEENASNIHQNSNSIEKSSKMTDNEIVAIIGHEFGHWKKSHNILHFLIAEINLFFTFYIFQLFYKNDTFFEAFGFQQNPIIIGFLLLTYLNFYHKFAEIFQTFINRKMEFSADQFSADLGFVEDLSNALIKLGHDNFSLPLNDPLFAAIHHAHPSVQDRIKALKKYV